jgi:hypothetical protein
MLLKVLPKWIVDGAEWTTQRLPGFLKRRLHTSMSVLLSKPA